MNNKFAGFIPFKDEASWWAAQFEADCTCTSCGLDYHCDELSELTGLCADCDEALDSAIVIVPDEPEWEEGRARVEAWLHLRGM